MSTVKAVADEVRFKLTEDAIPNPITHYGLAKLQAEAYILSKDLPQGKRIYILRPCMIHGPGNKGNLNLLYNFVCKGLPWPLGAFENQRSFLSIGNLCFVIQQLLARDNIPMGIYNVADDGSLSINEIIQLVGLSMKKKIKIWNISAHWIKKTARIGDYFHLPLNTERLQKMTENYVVSNDKIKKAIGEPLPINIKEGLLITFKAF